MAPRRASDWVLSSPDAQYRFRRRLEPPRSSRIDDLAGYEYWLGDEAVRYEMREWIPDEVGKYAEGSWMMGEAPWTEIVRLRADREDEFVAAFERAGYTCRRDDALICAALGLTGD